MADVAHTLESHQPADRDKTLECLQKAARIAASWDVVHRPTTHGSFGKRVHTVARALAALESRFAALGATQTRKSGKVDPVLSALLTLRDNHKALRSGLLAVSGDQRAPFQLPRVLFAAGHEEPRVAALAQVYLRAVNFVFTPDTFVDFIQTLQAQEPLTHNELWNLTAFLQFVIVESVLQDACALCSQRSATPSDFTDRLKSLVAINHADWLILIEPLIAFDVSLRQDPAGAYEKMDCESRQLYRDRVAAISRQSDCTESEVAQAALDLARMASEKRSSDARVQLRRMHIGYYLVDKGLSRLEGLVGFHPSLAWRARQFIRANAEDFYIGGIILLSALFLAVVLFPVLPRFVALVPLLLAILTILPSAFQNAVEVINHSITTMFRPEALPKLDFSDGVPADYTTLIVIPSLLLSEKQVRQLVNNLEVHFRGNRDPKLYFALLTDLPDSVTKPREADSHPLLELAVRLIDELNAKYGAQQNGSFMLLHRHRIFNKRQGVWMSWERKRGKLLDLNKLLIGEFDAFPIKAGRADLLPRVRYILTLDADTQLPRGAAARLVGAIAHPLNQAVIDPKLRVVTAGYGILQPRVGIAVRSAARSRMAAIFSGQSGFDIYTHATSDVYQDLFGEGIFAGKGIYEVATLHTVLNHRFPRNALLSHDLIEGAYARAGLASDIELIDDYPSHYSAYSRRQHRWVRGDWQIAQWMFSTVPDESGRLGPNPISSISRWKIFDNLRRSLVDPSLVILIAAGWLGLPGGPVYWTLASLFLLFFPAMVPFLFNIGGAISHGRIGQVRGALSALGRAILVTLFRLILLLHRTLLAVDAVLRALFRRFVSGELLLEWETAAQAELQSAPRAPADTYLGVTLLVAVALAGTIAFLPVRHEALYVALPIIALWAISSFVVKWLDRAPHRPYHLGRGDRDFLLGHALRTWQYFNRFSSAKHNYLIPDNVVEDGQHEAARVSPTNIGMLLNARQAACELGFLTVPEFAALTNHSLTAIARLEKFRGNLHNWYSTDTLESLGSPFVSSVDNGNLVASLFALRGGLRELGQKPLLQSRLFSGLRAHWRLMCAEGRLPSELKRLRVPGESASVSGWIEWLPAAEAALSSAVMQPAGESTASWMSETLRRVVAIRTLLRDYLPWMLPEYRPLHQLLKIRGDEALAALTVDEASLLGDALLSRIPGPSETLADPRLAPVAERLRESLFGARENLRALATKLRLIEQSAETLADATDFSFLVHRDRQVLSIGYDVASKQLQEACYDLFASEARMATFLTIARGDLPMRSWFKLDREHVYAYGRFVVLSWTGTMFEYLMPGLWMRSLRGTLEARTEAASVYAQRAFARPLGIPWGISESGRARRDDAGNLGYHAFGLPSIALSSEATAGPVISPYSTFLALRVDPDNAIGNLRRMEAMGWVGAYGFYESADYSESPRGPVLVREWMAHHQGMSLLAVTNLLRDNIIQHWFHANPVIQATELLLHELPASNAALRARQRELAFARS